MIFKPFKILEYTSYNDKWQEREFTQYTEWLSFLYSCYKFPGEYNFKNTEKWVENATRFTETKKYTDASPRSKDYKEFWLLERRKCKQGVIMDGVFLSPDFYWFINYCPIFNKVEMKFTFPEIWDGHYHYDLFIYLATQEDQDIAMTKARQKGMEQPDTEAVMHIDGWKTMGETQVGDLVATPKGTYTKVLEKFPQGLKDVYQLTLSDGRTVRCGLDHLWKVRDNRAKKDIVIQLRDLLNRALTRKATAPLKSGEKKEYVAYNFSIPEIDPVPFEKRDLKIPPYVMGILLGDGEFKTTPLISSADPEIFDRVLELMGPDYQYGAIEQLENHQRKGLIYKHRFDKEKHPDCPNGVNLLTRHIKEYGLFKCTKNAKFIPDDYLHSSVEDRIELLRGLMDSDGYVNAGGYDLNFTSASPTLLEQVLYLCRSLGLPAFISQFEGHGRVRIGNKISLFHLQRKKDRQRLDRKRFENTNIVEIKKLDYQEESSCILVEDPDHMYLTTSFIPTHNSLYHVSRLARKLWFYQKANLKILGYEEAYLDGEWTILSDYRNHLNENTGWYRNFSPDESFNWIQQIEVSSGIIEKKKTYKGNKSRIRASITKRNISKGVGGAASEIYCTEAGIFRNLKKVKEYVDPNIKMGGVKTGLFCAAGAVGELDDAADLMEFCFNPKAYNIRSVKDVFSGSEDDIGFFFPDEWNYIYKDEKSGQIVKCYDKHGNSDLSKAREFLDKEEQLMKNKDEMSYKLWKSQHPRTLQEAFDQREDNPFPTQELRELEFKLLQQKDIIVKFERDHTGKLTYKFDKSVPVDKIKPRPNDDNRGAVIIKEFPPDKPPFGLFYAGVDPIYNLDTSTSTSLMSITVWIGWHERDGKICEPYPVATYTGRHKKVTDTYEICLSLIEFYNARTAVESNVKDFIEWMIKQKASRYLMRRKELTVINEMMPNSTIRDEIGFRMEGEFKKRCIEKLVTWLTTPVATSFDMETGESEEVYNTQKLWDKMFVKEMLRYSPKLNTDRLVGNLGALIACQSDSNRHIVNVVKHNKPQGTSHNKNLPSAFRSSVNLQSRKSLLGHFRKK